MALQLLAMSARKWAFFVVLLTCSLFLVSAGGLFGNEGAEVESDGDRLQRPEDALVESGKTWILERTVNENTGESFAKHAATKLMNGSTSLTFTKEQDELRSRKFIVHFSTGERGYWRVGRGGTGGILSKLSPNMIQNAVLVKDRNPFHQVIKRYEDAVLENPATEILEIEVLQNQPNKRSRKRYKRTSSSDESSSSDSMTQGPVLVYQIPVAFGRVQKGSLVNDVPGVIRLLSGEVAKKCVGDYSYSEHADVMETKALAVGNVNLKLMHGRGLIDPFWARGRQWFFHGRSKGNL